MKELHSQVKSALINIQNNNIYSKLFSINNTIKRYENYHNHNFYFKKMHNFVKPLGNFELLGQNKRQIEI